MLHLPFSDLPLKSARILGFPRPQTGPRIPISWKRGLRGKTNPFPLSEALGPVAPIHLPLELSAMNAIASLSKFLFEGAPQNFRTGQIPGLR